MKNKLLGLFSLLGMGAAQSVAQSKPLAISQPKSPSAPQPNLNLSDLSYYGTSRGAIGGTPRLAQMSQKKKRILNRRSGIHRTRRAKH